VFSKDESRGEQSSLMVKQIDRYNILDTCSNKSATVASGFSQNTDSVLRYLATAER
jgi:hypothetical protein